MHQCQTCGKIDIIMVMSLFKKLEQILAGSIFEKEKEKGQSFQREVQCGDIGMYGN